MKISYLITCIVLTLSLQSCFIASSEKEEAPKEEVSSKSDNSGASSDNPLAALKTAVEEIEKAAGGMKTEDGEKVETIHFKELQERLPERLAGYSRKSKSGQTNSIMGFKISQAEASYQDGDGKIEVSINDTGGAGLALMSMAAWSQFESEQESDDGWEKTGEWDGYKCYETYSKSRNRSTIALIVADRVVVNAEGNVDMDELKRFLKKMNLEKIS